jgi:hypothetical protein
MGFRVEGFMHEEALERSMFGLGFRVFAGSYPKVFRL